MTTSTILRATALFGAVLTALVMGAAPASAQPAGGKGQRQGTPVRTSATVEVIDSTAAVDDIIGRLRKEQRDRATGEPRGAASQNSGPTGKAAQDTPAQSHDRTAVRELKQERQAGKHASPRGELPSTARHEHRQGGPDGNPAAERRQMGYRRPAGAGRTQ